MDWRKRGREARCSPFFEPQITPIYTDEFFGAEGMKMETRFWVMPYGMEDACLGREPRAQLKDDRIRKRIGTRKLRTNGVSIDSRFAQARLVFRLKFRRTPDGTLGISFGRFSKMLPIFRMLVFDVLDPYRP